MQKVLDEMFYGGLDPVAVRTVIDPSAPGAPTPASFRSEAMLMDSLGELDFVARILAVHWASMTMVLEWFPGGSAAERLNDQSNEWSYYDRLYCGWMSLKGVLELQTILGPGKAVVHGDIKVRLIASQRPLMVYASLIIFSSFPCTCTHFSPTT